MQESSSLGRKRIKNKITVLKFRGLVCSRGVFQNFLFVSLFAVLLFVCLID